MHIETMIAQKHLMLATNISIILTLMCTIHMTRAEKLSQTTTMYIGKVENCSQEVVNHRSILELSTGHVGRIECVRQCVWNILCEVVVYQVFQHGSESCMKLSMATHNNLETPEVPASIECVTVFIIRCQNGGQMSDGVCLCQNGFTGLVCEQVNPDVCDVKWTRAIFALEDHVDYNSQVAQTFGHTEANIVFRDKETGTLFNIKGQDSGTDSPDTSGYGYFVSYPFFEKISWDRFASSPQRQRLHYLVNGSVQLLSFSGSYGNYSFSNSNPLPSIITPRNTIFAVKRELPNDRALLLEDISKGYEMFHTSWLQVNEKDTVAQLADRIFILQYTGSFAAPPVRSDYKFVLGQMTHVTTFTIGSGIVTSWSQDYSNDIYMNPCWMSVNEKDNPTNPSISSLKFVETYLKRGNNVRIKIGTTYHSVIEVISVESSFAFLLAPFLSEREPSMFTSRVYEIRSLVTSTALYQSCSHGIGQEQVVASSQYQYPYDVEYFVDTRRWTLVFAVFSNASVSQGSVQALANGVQNGYNVRIWIRWLTSGVSRFMDTQKSTLTSDGKVSTESLVSWQTTIDSEVLLSPKCDLQYVLVTSDGRMDILVFNDMTPGVSQAQTDVLVTWFLG